MPTMNMSHVLFNLLWLSALAAADSQTAEDIQQVIRRLGDNSTALRNTMAASWVDSPTIRGSMDILWTCIVTLVACVYTALHLNIPAKKGPYAGFIDKLRWVFVAIVAPETVLVLAANQFFEARGLKGALAALGTSERDIVRALLDYFVLALARHGGQSSIPLKFIRGWGLFSFLVCIF